ncbi:MAG: folate-binding protein YgfZ [Gammaproteobacteria bacterium]|nr:folate-binding protein YgfZ [Gammaproteobacteria bacterium]
MMPSENTLFNLPNLCTLKLLGDNATTFLQGQLSCDVNAVNSHQMRQSAFCNLKGRVLALPDVLKFHDVLHLILPIELLEKTEKSLTKTAALSRVTLEQEKKYELFGFYLKDAKQPLPIEGTWPTEKHATLESTDAFAYHLGDAFYVLLIHQDNLNKLQQFKFKTQDAEAWHALRLAHGEVQIYPASRGVFLPHRLELHTSGHLNFDKGCYKGQEIIARMHYRAKQKHALKLFKIKTSEPLRPGLRLMREDNTQEIGELVDFCLLGNNQYLIAASVSLDCPNTMCFETHTTPTLLDPIAS